MSKQEWTRPISAREVFQGIIGAVVGGSATAVAILFGFSPGLILIFGLLFWIPAILLHELAHAVSGKAVGGEVSCIKLGLTTNPTGNHFSFIFLGFPWKLYAVPFTGSVWVYFIDPYRYRSRVITMIAAGPLASLFAALTGIIPLLINANRPGGAQLAAWFLVNFYFFIGTSLPYSRIRKGHISQTDGYRIGTLFRLSDAEIVQKCFQSRLQIDLKTEKEEIAHLPMEDAIARYEANPDRIATLAHLIGKMGQAKDLRQNEFVMRLISYPKLPSTNLAAFLDSYLTTHLDQGTIANSSYFDQFSQKLMTTTHQSITAQGTRGSVLIDLGRIDEGSAMLREVLSKTTSDLDKTYANIFLALAEKQKGNLDAARAHAREAVSVNHDCPAIQRISDLLLVSTDRAS
jgi:tetratricopeptide (TPR) repeat protein